MHLGLPAGRSVEVVRRCRDRSSFVYFLANNWPSPIVLHSVMRRSQDKSMLGCNNGYGIMTGNNSSVPILVMDRFYLFIGLGTHTPAYLVFS